MIKIKPNMLYVKDPATGEFTQLLAIKGNPGSISNIDEYFVTNTGDSELLAMTQKGATDIKNKLAEDIADTKSELEKNINTAKSELAESISSTNTVLEDTKSELKKDINDVLNTQTVATANYANYLHGGEVTVGPARPVWFSDSTYYDRKVYSKRFMYDPSTDTLKVSNITGRAANLSYKLISSIDELTSLAKGGMCYAIMLSANIPINDLIFPANARGMIVANGSGALYVIGEDGVIYTAFYNYNKDAWYGARKSSQPTCITELPSYAVNESPDDHADYPPTAKAVHDSIASLYVSLEMRIAALEKHIL